MKQRLVTIIMFLPIFLGIMLTNNFNVIVISVFILSMIGLKEFYNSFQKLDTPYMFLGFLGGTVLYIMLTLGFENYILAFILIYCFLLSSLAIFKYTSRSIRNIGITLLGILYVPFLFSFIVQVYTINEIGYLLTWFIFIISWSTDSFACLVGLFFGRRKITPILSPKKSLEGFIGGTVCTTLISIAFGILASELNLVDINNFVFICGLLGFFGSIVSQIGDLVASAIKRQNEIKDYGRLFPGHGGVLDRFDSVIFVAPAIYLICQFI